MPLTTSRVVGSPDPPPPYRVKRVYPEPEDHLSPSPSSISRAATACSLITQDWPYGPTTIVRIKDEPDASTIETLLDHGRRRLRHRLSSRISPKNGYVYVGSNGPPSGASAAKRTRVTRYTMDRKPPYTLDPEVGEGHHRMALRRPQRRRHRPSATTACSTSPPATAPPIPTPTSSART